MWQGERRLWSEQTLRRLTVHAWCRGNWLSCYQGLRSMMCVGHVQAAAFPLLHSLSREVGIRTSQQEWSCSLNTPSAYSSVHFLRAQHSWTCYSPAPSQLIFPGARSRAGCWEGHVEITLSEFQGLAQRHTSGRWQKGMWSVSSLSAKGFLVWLLDAWTQTQGQKSFWGSLLCYHQSANVTSSPAKSKCLLFPGPGMLLPPFPFQGHPLTHLLFEGRSSSLSPSRPESLTSLLQEVCFHPPRWTACSSFVFAENTSVCHILYQTGSLYFCLMVRLPHYTVVPLKLGPNLISLGSRIA